MTAKPEKMTPILAAAALAVATGFVTGCCHPRSLPVAVPDLSQRVVVSIPDDSAGARAAVLAAMAELTCLIGSPQADGRACSTSPLSEPTCTTARDATARLFWPLLDAVPEIRLTTPLATEVSLRRQFPGFTVTTREVRDARRHLRCDTWSDGKCVALARKDVWVLLKAGPTRDRPDTVEVFLGRENLCDRSGAPGH